MSWYGRSLRKAARTRCTQRIRFGRRSRCIGEEQGIGCHAGKCSLRLGVLCINGSTYQIDSLVSTSISSLKSPKAGAPFRKYTLPCTTVPDASLQTAPPLFAGKRRFSVGRRVSRGTDRRDSSRRLLQRCFVSRTFNKPDSRRTTQDTAIGLSGDAKPTSADNIQTNDIKLFTCIYRELSESFL